MTEHQDEPAVMAKTLRDHVSTSSSYAETASSTDAATASDVQWAPNGLPRHVEGGFAGVAMDLDRRSRDWSMMHRLLEQQRLQLETSENERERLYAELELLLPEVQTTALALTRTIARTRSGDVSANLSALFVDNLHALDKLENVSKALTANLLWTRSSWEQYARSVIGAEKMRSDVKA